MLLNREIEVLPERSTNLIHPSTRARAGAGAGAGAGAQDVAV